MSTNINNTIQQYQQQKASVDTELQKINTDIAVSENNLKNLQSKAFEMFGTNDANMLATMLTNLTTEFDTLTTELNNLNNSNQAI